MLVGSMRPTERGRCLPVLAAALCLLLLCGCHQAADVDGSSDSAAPHLTLVSDALPADAPPVAPLFKALTQTMPLPALVIAHAPLPPRPPDVQQVAQEAVSSPSTPVPAPPAGATPPGSLGLLVCDPVCTTGSLLDFGVGCGHWLHLMAAGQAALGRTPLWSARQRVMTELARRDLRLTPAEVNVLPDMIGITHVACGHLDGNAERCTLTYQLYALPDAHPVGTALSVSGSLSEVLAGLPTLAQKIDAQLGIAATLPAVSLPPPDVTWLGSVAAGRSLSDADLLRLSRLSARSPLAGLFLMSTWATDDQQVLTQTVKALLAQQPQNTLVVSHIGYTSPEVLRPYAAATQTLFRRFPENCLLAHTEVWEQRVWGARPGEWKAARRVCQDSPHDPDAWLTPATTISNIAEDLRQGRFAADLTQRDWKYLNSLYQEQEQDCLEATRLDARDGHAWRQLAENATFASDQRTAEAAFAQAERLDPDKAEVADWGLQMFQSKWGGDAATLERVAREAADVPYDDANTAVDMVAQLKGAKFDALATGVLSGFLARQRAVVRSQPGSVQGHWSLAAALAAQDDPVSRREATREYRIASHLMPNAPRLHYYLGKVLDQRPGKGPEAIAEFRQAVALDPFYAQAHFELGYDLKHAHQFSEALSELQLAMRLNPRDAEAHFGIGELLGMQNTHTAAIAEYREAVRMTPYFPGAWGALAYECDVVGQDDQALIAGREAVRIAEIGATGSEGDTRVEISAHDTMADVYLHKKEWGASLRESQAALGYDGADPVAHENLAEAYFGQGRLADAHTEWKRVLTLSDPAIAAVARKLLAEHP